MRNLDDPEFAPWLVNLPWAKQQIGRYNDRFNAVMEIPCGMFLLRVIAARGGGWDHVSVSLATRTPTWSEMEFVKRKLFKPDEVAMQLHLPPDDHISIHPNVLHIWRPWSRKKGEAIPLPPKSMV